jgi:hypothetical protein
MARIDFPIFELDHYQRPGWSLILKGNYSDYYPSPARVRARAETNLIS